MEEKTHHGGKWAAGGVIATVVFGLLTYFPEPMLFIRRVLHLAAEPVPVRVVEWPPINIVNVTAPPPETTTTTTQKTAPAGVLLPKTPQPDPSALLLNSQLRAMESGSWPWAVIVYGESQADDVAVAASTILRRSGRENIRLFRDAATEARLAPDLFRGSPALGTDLQLARYCARLLIGRLKTNVRDSDGTLIGEATVMFRLLTPDGDIVSTREISAKGAGPTAEAAKERAIAELCETMAGEMSEILQ
jgi:hypothetical protein